MRGLPPVRQARPKNGARVLFIPFKLFIPHSLFLTLYSLALHAFPVTLHSPKSQVPVSQP